MAILTSAPDPNPKRPRLKAPPGACDCHVHLFGPASHYPFAPDTPYHARDALPETLFWLQETLGLSRAVLVSPGAYGCNYDLLADVLAKHPHRLRGVALLKTDTPKTELARLDWLGVKGVRMITPARGAHLPHYDPVLAARVHELGWHVQFYSHGTEIIDFADQLLALPNDIVLDHMAAIPAAGGVEQPAVKAVLRMLDTGRVWLKLSGPMRCTPGDPPYAEVTPLARAFVKHTPERLVWASDWPHANMDGRTMPNDGDLFDLLAEWVPDETVRNRILVDNAVKLYGF